MPIDSTTAPFWIFAAMWVLHSSSAAQPQPVFELQRDIVYADMGDTKLELDAYLPAGAGPHPAVLVIHGGAWRSGGKRQLAGYARELAERGFAAFAINYRLAPQHQWPAQIEDCRAAVQWIRANAAKYNVDPTRLAAVGYSAGGHLAALLGTTGKSPDQQNGVGDTRIQAVVAGGAPIDFRLMPKNSKGLSYWLGGTRGEKPDPYREASPNAFVSADAPPMFFFSGSKDTLVPPVFTRPMHQSLKRAGVASEFHELKGATHLSTASDRDVLDKAWDFLESHLLPKQDEAVGEE